LLSLQFRHTHAAILSILSSFICAFPMRDESDGDIGAFHIVFPQELMEVAQCIGSYVSLPTFKPRILIQNNWDHFRIAIHLGISEKIPELLDLVATVDRIFVPGTTQGNPSLIITQEATFRRSTFECIFRLLLRQSTTPIYICVRQGETPHATVIEHAEVGKPEFVPSPYSN